MFKIPNIAIEDYCNYRYYNECNLSTILQEVQKNIDPSITVIKKEYIFIFHKILNTDPCTYWNKDIYLETIRSLEELYLQHKDSLIIEETIFNFFLMGYNSYTQLTDIILDLKNFNISQELKTRLYRLPTYTSLLESCLSNFLRVIVNLTGQGIGKDYSAQNTLGQLINVIKANGYDKIAKYADINIRNAINHGKISMKGNKNSDLIFFYNEKNIAKTKEMSVYDFDRIIDNTFDMVSGVFLALTVFFNNHDGLVNIDITKKEYVPFAFLAMKFSLPNIQCLNISDTGNLKQLNVELKINNTDRGYIGQIATLLSTILYETHRNYEQYMFSFSHPRMMNGWIRYKNKELLDIATHVKDFNEVLSEVIKRSDFIIFDTSTEDIDLNEIKYFCFPNFNSSSFKINSVEDASLPDRKRLKAHLFIGKLDKKEDILNVIKQAIIWLKTVKNPPSPTFPQKHGNMPADSLYINVYRNDGRKSKELYTSNENFVCFVDYNIDGITSLEDGGLPKIIWKSYYHEKLDNIQIAWREKKYLTRCIKKTGRNDPCPCGSGLKYKKCCGNKVRNNS